MSDFRTEEIRARLAAYPEPMVATVESIDFDPPCAHVDLVYALESRLPATPGPYAEFLNHAPADLAYLLDRNKALEEERADYGAGILAADMERDRYRAESDDYRELWEQKCAEAESDNARSTLAALLASLETLRDQWRETPGDGWRAIAYRSAADDLHRVIEGARGC